MGTLARVVSLRTLALKTSIKTTSTLCALRHRNDSKIYWPGSGVRTKKEIEEEAKCRREGKWPEEDPLNFTLLGKRRVTKQDLLHYTDRRAGKGYTDFAETPYEKRPYIYPGLRYQIKYYVWIAMFMLPPLLVDFEWFRYNIKYIYRKWFKTDAATVEEGQEDDEEEDNDEANTSNSNAGTPVDENDGTKEEEKPNGQVPSGSANANSPVTNPSNTTDAEEVNCSIYDSAILNKKRRPKVGFRERRIIHYEDRIRAYSSPDKIFRYFATVKLLYEDGSFDVFMTPEDFVRSLTPGVMQPRKYGLDKYKAFNANEVHVHYSDRESIFFWLTKTGGLINFADYLFLMTLLSTSPSEFRLAFFVFDLNGDGELDRQEFERVQELVLSQSNIGQRHRDHVTGAGTFVKSSKNSAITKYFFGTDQSQKLGIETFLKFQQDLHRDILKIEFERRDPESGPEGIISEISFAELLLIHSDLPEKRQRRMMKRVRRRYGKESKQDNNQRRGISFAEVNDFFAFIYHIDRVDLALHFYKLAGKSLSKELLQRVARKITGVQLSDTVLEVVIQLFDDNGDGELSQREFVAIMKKRKQRGLERPKDTGLLRLVGALWSCSKQQVAKLVEQKTAKKKPIEGKAVEAE